MLAERIGASCLMSALQASGGGFGNCGCTGVRVLGVAAAELPAPARAHVRTRAATGVYHFEAEAHLPLGGLLVRYAGWLERV